MSALTKEEFAYILRAFGFTTKTVPFGNGHINDTFLIDGTPKHVLQRINKDVFKDPVALMDNVAAVTEYIIEQTAKLGLDTERCTLHLCKTVDGKNVFCTANGEYYRVYRFIDGCDSPEKSDDLKYYYNAAVAIGNFYRLLEGFDAASLTETISKFHHTRQRFENLKAAIAADKAGRAASVQAEIDFALARESMTDVILDAMRDGSVPVRVTHNDTKMNNILFDKKTAEPVCLIDLDTVMPGSFLYDYGDFLRFAANTGEEDDTDLSLVRFDLNVFTAFTKGCFDSFGASLTAKEIELMPLAVMLMTYECGIRFLEDHLNGDTYFKVHRENHNLDRARTQFKLVADMERLNTEMVNIIAQAYCACSRLADTKNSTTQEGGLPTP